MKKTLGRFMVLALVALLALGAAIPALAVEAGADMDDGMLEVIVSYGLELVSVLLVTLIGVGGTWLTLKLGKKQELANVRTAMEQVVYMAQITVGELQQTVVNAIKQGGGKLDDELIAKLQKDLISMTEEKLSIPTIALLEAAKVDITALITGAGEDWIGKMKAA